VPSGSRYRIMDFTRISRGARLRRTIVDRHNLVERDACIGFDPTEDATRYEVSPNGIVVVPRGRPPYFARDSRSPGMGYSE
jgi:glucose-1-phosphate adenylyltransferase